MKRPYLIILALAFVLCGVAWMRFFYVAATHLSPVRYVSFEDASGPRASFRQLCYGPAIVDADQVWRFCDYGDPDVRGLARFDLDSGQADLKWPIPQSADAQLLALAQAPTGELVTAWGSPDLAAVYRLDPSGSVSLLDGLPGGAWARARSWASAEWGMGHLRSA
ncbi:MAG TPA: hypothetical protein VHP83_17500 [Aggregatilineaceae bacterium]|nr:hypothetical protein [Aggregatilineaceae bacterium]